MKRKIGTLFLSAVLTMSLAACSKTEQKDPQMDSQQDTQTAEDDGQTPYIDGVETPAERSGKEKLEEDGDMARRALEDAAKDAEDTSGNDWDDMLRNAHVQDTDGDLTDGENALHGRYGVEK